MAERIIAPTAEHQKFLGDLKQALANNVNLRGEEMLAIASIFLGQLIAAQDQKTMTPQRAMAIVTRNIEAGNQQAIIDMQRPRGTA